jgi:hypothetical protein
VGARRRTIMTLHLPMPLADAAALFKSVAELYSDARLVADETSQRPVITTAKTITGQLDLGEGEE